MPGGINRFHRAVFYIESVSPLKITGQLIDGTPFEGGYCVVILVPQEESADNLEANGYITSKKMVLLK